MKYTYTNTLPHVVSEKNKVIGVYLQNPRIEGLLSPAPPGWRRPLEMKYTWISPLRHVVSEYIWL